MEANLSKCARPRIANVYPDFMSPVSVPHIITMENAGENLEIWTWEPEPDMEGTAAAAASFDPGAVKLPEEPPEDAERIDPIDVDGQVVVAELTGTVVWVKNEAGLSGPCPINRARPFWVSHEEACRGDTLFMFGFGLRDERKPLDKVDPRRRPPARIVLRREGKVREAKTIQEGRSTQWDVDPRLVHFRLPTDLEPGRWDVLVHNGRGGEPAWALSDSIEVKEATEQTRVFDVREFGGTGDGLANDLEAICSAAQAAAKAGGGTVFLPPGTWRIDQTLRLPANVALRGAGMQNTVLEGFGHDPARGKPAAVLALTDGTGLRKLTVRGAVSKGMLPHTDATRSDISTDAMIRLLPQEPGEVVEDVSILGCRLRALEEAMDGRETWYLKCIHVGEDARGRCRNFRLNNNEIHGSLFFWRGERMQIIRNRWHESTPTILVSIHGWASDSILDGNIFTDTPGRICFYPERHCCIRYNEVHGAPKGSWSNAEEIFLVHGSHDDYFWDGQAHYRTVSTATGGSENTLRDAHQNWEPDSETGSVVLITAGRGMGQYRNVTSNTPDTLTVDRPWRVEPDETSEYVLGWMYLENAFYANVNDTPMRMSLWYDCIGNIVDRHRDEFAKGIDLWAADQSVRKEDGSVERGNRFLPSYYNMVVRCWMDGTFAHLHSSASADNAHRGAPMFGNYLVENRVRQPHMHRTGFGRPVLAEAGIRVGNRRHDMTELRGDRVALSHSIVARNQLSFTNIGITVADRARKTFLLQNIFQRVDQPVIDWGARTLSSGNAVVSVDETGTRKEDLPEEENRREIQR